MSHMFYNAESFNQKLGGWNTANTTNMSYMFAGALDFNQTITKEIPGRFGEVGKVRIYPEIDRYTNEFKSSRNRNRQT